MRRVLLIACGLLAGAAPAVSGQPIPVAAPYDTQADAPSQVAAAFAEAKRSGREVLLDFGGNWCPDCRMLAGVMEMPSVRPWIDAHFVPVAVDVGRFSKNMEIAQRYGVRVTAVPAVLVLTPDGRLLDPDGVRALGNARAMTAQGMVDLLAQWGARGGAV